MGSAQTNISETRNVIINKVIVAELLPRALEFFLCGQNQEDAPEEQGRPNFAIH